ncbi:hypothetical protein ENUP19_0054G0003 [Entamoeba nuttalli]|uniref:Las1 family protein n=2 Tax=Entamoeba nuttalli TaxID=412467 RepID=K2H9F7_ENTNP|nr:Las1 family protein [Entamoeba nuttalli P19]EKE39214.1 Las1 family protein [Entamoeba nuttalli P19]|eukprot:XP_008858450.1 Las1 family protein [Entamoeba nuttalli P19]
MTSAWMNWDEWKNTQVSVLEALREPNEEKVKEALNLLLIWQTRQILPVQIEATIGVLNSMCANVESPQFFSSVAGFTIVRFVNGMVDAPQKAGGQHRSVYQMAVELGVPTVLVEVRHSITHGTVPSSEELIECIKIISEYLAVNYWERGSQESSRIWFDSFIEAVERRDSQRIMKSIKEGSRNMTSSSLYELSSLIVRIGKLQGDESKWWKMMVTQICSRRGFSDVLIVGAAKEYCKEIKQNTEQIEEWIIYCISVLSSEVNEVLNVFKSEGVLFENKTQILLKKIHAIINGEMKKIIGGFIIHENLKFKEMECEEIEQFVNEKIQINECEIGQWKKLGELPQFFVSTENLIIDPSISLMIAN